LASTEECEDNDLENGDGCSSTCKIENNWICDGSSPISLCVQIRITGCGNGFLEAEEECDDMNLMSFDGCSKNCKKEVGFNCEKEGFSCSPICGDGLVVSGEICDPGPNNLCTSNCLTINSEYFCYVYAENDSRCVTKSFTT